MLLSKNGVQIFIIGNGSLSAPCIAVAPLTASPQPHACNARRLHVHGIGTIDDARRAVPPTCGSRCGAVNGFGCSESRSFFKYVENMSNLCTMPDTLQNGEIDESRDSHTCRQTRDKHKRVSIRMLKWPTSAAPTLQLFSAYSDFIRLCVYYICSDRVYFHFCYCSHHKK